MLNDLINDLNNAFDDTVEALKRDVAKVRTGRANPNILDGIKIDYYGTPTPINQIAAIKIADARLITIQPWEKNTLAQVEKAILVSDLGLNPSNDGTIIRLPIPALTGERRREFTKQVKEFGEKAKISVRNQRRDTNELLKTLQKDGEASEDDVKRALTKVQEATDEYIKKIDLVVAEKEKEIMEI